MERKPRFVELFTSVISGRRLEEVALIILHIHTRFDPCSVCAEMLCKLSQTLNYQPARLIQDEKLCLQLRDHRTQFLIEVSSDDPYWNSREAGFDEFYAMQLADIEKFGMQPIEILSAENFPKSSADIIPNILPSNYFPPFVIFKRMDRFSILKCLKK